MKRDFRFKGQRPEDIFEAITVMAKRARQINQRRNEEYPIQTMVDVESEEYVDSGIDFDSFEKPASLAMEEYERGEIEFEYEEKKVVDEDLEEEA